MHACLEKMDTCSFCVQQVLTRFYVTLDDTRDKFQTHVQDVFKECGVPTPIRQDISSVPTSTF